MAGKAKTCRFCGEKLKRDWIALNKKFLGRNVEEFMCIACLAENLDCTVEDLQTKIEEFKEEGCTLFG